MASSLSVPEPTSPVPTRRRQVDAARHYPASCSDEVEQHQHDSTDYFCAAALMIPCSIVLSSRETVYSLQEVVGRPARHHGLASTRAGVELEATMCQL
jgi:hypothetical protein